MDAISFVVGLQSKDLRGKQLKDLVFKSSADEDICMPAFANACFHAQRSHNRHPPSDSIPLPRPSSWSRRIGVASVRA